jgi:hypothetical protein
MEASEKEIVEILPVSNAVRKMWYEVTYLQQGILHTTTCSMRELKKDFGLSTEKIEAIVIDSMKNYRREEDDDFFEEDDDDDDF